MFLHWEGACARCVCEWVCVCVSLCMVRVCCVGEVYILSRSLCEVRVSILHPVRELLIYSHFFADPGSNHPMICRKNFLFGRNYLLNNRYDDLLLPHYLELVFFS